MIKLPTQSEVLSYKSIYGDPRNRNNVSLPSVKWEAENLTRIVPPYRMTYAGTPIKSIRIHKACADNFSNLFELLKDTANNDQKTLDHWGVSIFGGSYVYRLMRGLNTLSMHSFGCAVDIDPARNGLGDSTPRFAEFPEVVATFRKSGLCWGFDWDGDGTSKNQKRFDAMHLQATMALT